MADLSDAIDTAIKKELDKGPSNTGGVGVVAEGGGGRPVDAGVAGDVSIDVGKKGGWSGFASGEWWKGKGWKGFGGFTWKGK